MLIKLAFSGYEIFVRHSISVSFPRSFCAKGVPGKPFGWLGGKL
jgi:hypothetical protein